MEIAVCSWSSRCARALVDDLRDEVLEWAFDDFAGGTDRRAAKRMLGLR